MFDGPDDPIMDMGGRIDFLEQHLAELEAENARYQWISVEDRLPETPDDVLVAYSDGTVTSLCYFKNDNVWMDEYGGVYDEITHWMPLPKAPENPDRTEEE